MARSDAVVRCEGVGKVYRLASGEVAALRDVDLEVPAGTLTVVAGPSGSGKSTLLRQVGLLERPSTGRVLLGGTDTTGLGARARRRLRRDRVAYVFQRPTDNLVDGVDAAGQLRLAAELRGAAEPDVEGILAVVGLVDRAGHPPMTLSGGEQQRLALAAALASGAGLVVADEPTAQLDSVSGAAVVVALGALRDAGATVVVCSHDEIVVGAADQVVRLDAGRRVEA